jgi:hypothetical protein
MPVMYPRRVHYQPFKPAEGGENASDSETLPMRLCIMRAPLPAAFSLHIRKRCDCGAARIEAPKFN